MSSPRKKAGQPRQKRGENPPPRKIRSGRPSRGPVQAIGVRFPLAYLKIMETEADLLGVTRGQFLTMLVKRKRGELKLERGTSTTEYDVSDNELRTTRLYVWHVSPAVRQAIDEERL